MKQKIAIIHYASPPIFGGVERVLADHIETLVSCGFDIKLITGAGSQYRTDIEYCSVPEINTQDATNLQILQEVLQGQLTETFNRRKDFFKVRLQELLADCSHAIIHNIMSMHMCLPLTLALRELMAERQTNVKFINYIHDNVYLDDEIKEQVCNLPPVVKTWLTTLPEAHTTVAISHARATELAGIYQVDPSRFQVIHNGVNVLKFLNIHAEVYQYLRQSHILERDVIFLYPTRIAIRKNILRALQIVKDLVELKYKPALLITGPIDPHLKQDATGYAHTIDQFIQDNHLEPYVFQLYRSALFGDGLSHYDYVRDLYIMSDALLFTTKAEGFGIPIYEAALMSKPIVCTGIPVLRELAGENAFYLDEDAAVRPDYDQLMNFVFKHTVPSFRKIVMQKGTTQAIVENEIVPLLTNS